MNEKYIYINELSILENIIDDIIFYDEPTIFDDHYALDLIETALYLMDEFIRENPTIISEEDFEEILLDEIKEVFYFQFEEDILISDYIEDDLNDLLEEAFNIYILMFYTERYTKTTNYNFTGNNLTYNENNTDTDNIMNTEKNSVLELQIQKLREFPQPTQRTIEWYQFRHNLITASNAYKAFESQSTTNQLIYEKCHPLKINIDETDVKLVNVNTSLHWGQKYEPLSVILYEDKYKTKVEDFGCIQHETYKFIGASPDGINVDKKSQLYGRMLEIKNVVSREITGIPKKEYWIQMQLQMEVCNLDECDFLETKFIEYPDRDSYMKDIKYSSDSKTVVDTSISCDDKCKGVIIYFHTKEGKPFYLYKPLNLIYENEILQWEEDMISLYQSEKYNYTYMKFIYWKLEKFSCVLVLRNREWFNNNISQLERVWKIIETERVTGFEHRAPVKKTKKDYNNQPVNLISDASQGCLLKFNKIIKIDTTEIND